MGGCNDGTRGNVWYNWRGPGCRQDHIVSPNHFSPDRPYDVAILGAGVIGCAIAYELSQYRLRIIVIDKAYDVGEGASKANSAIIHTGFDATPGSLESQLVTNASRQWRDLANKLKIPFDEVSALMLALSADQLDQLPVLKENALANGVDEIRLVSAGQARRLEPNISPKALGGLLIPRESIADPFSTSIAYAEVARTNGVDIVFGLKVLRVDNPGQAVKVIALEEDICISARYVVNACGLGSRALVNTYGGERMDLNPRRGQFIVYDRDCSHLIGRILLPIPTNKTKGMLVAPTIFGNLLAGPTAEDLPPDQGQATNTTLEGLAAVRASSIELCPALADQSVIATYAGLRCNCSQGSYWMRFDDGHPGIVTLSGIRSTGFTSSISTAQYVVERLSRECGLVLEKDPTATDSRSETRWPGWWRRPFDDSRRIDANPDYGRIVCSCENISRGEIQDALELAAGTATLDGLKRRTRVLTGRCQGFNCCVPVAEMISRHFDVPLGSVTKRGPGSEFIATGQSTPERGRTSSQSPRQEFKSHYKVVIVGAGPAGIGVAVGLAKQQIQDVLLLDRAGTLGGVPANYTAKPGGIPTFLVWRRGRVLFGQQFVALLARELSATRTQIGLECQVVAACQENKSVTFVNPHGKSEIGADAIVFACGARERTLSERGWIAGHRPARVFYTLQLLQLLDGCHVLPLERPLIAGSDVIAYSAAAKLQAAGARDVVMTDNRLRPSAGLLERLYFRRWSHPTWQPAADGICISDCHEIIGPAGGDQDRARDGVVVSGELLPNSELAVAAGLTVSRPDRVPLRRGPHELSSPGWFVAGAEVGGFRSAYASYRDGRRAGAGVAKYLRDLEHVVLD